MITYSEAKSSNVLIINSQDIVHYVVLSLMWAASKTSQPITKCLIMEFNKNMRHGQGTKE